VPPDDSTSVFSPHPEPPAEETNPWLQPKKSTVTQSRQKNEIQIGKDSAGAEKSKNQMKKRLLKGNEEREKARDDAALEISMDEVLKLPSTGEDQTTKAKGKEKTPRNGTEVDAAFEDLDTGSEVEAQEQQMKAKMNGKGIKAFKQRDLVALAFAGDDVVQVARSDPTIILLFTTSILRISRN
jgi:U3 small nucleolar RNA-associated protein 14